MKNFISGLRDLAIILVLVLVVVAGAIGAFQYGTTLTSPEPPRLYQRNIGYVADSLNTYEISRILRTARAVDTIEIYIAGPGGRIFTMNRLLNDIKQSRAHVVTISHGASISANSVLSLAGDEVRISPHTIFMFHLASSGGVMMPLNHPVQQMMVNLMAEYGAQYLTDTELVRILKGENVWIRDMADRVKRGTAEENKVRVQMLIKNLR